MISISALGRIREAMELLLEDGKIEWQGSLKKHMIIISIQKYRLDIKRNV
ncbi:hypothetical protein CoNPh17_CDS0107 [Staphylococcus phage S-CoN_Ph17]|nr:hypothetical protein CoNPh17_CDS0107 [Staphylococcus phage S-CoN_Ph17]